jgi:hypothetical protein
MEVCGRLDSMEMDNLAIQEQLMVDIFSAGHSSKQFYIFGNASYRQKMGISSPFEQENWRQDDLSWENCHFV